MRHVVLFKFGKEFDRQLLEKNIKTTYNQLKNDYHVIKDYELGLNCLENDNMDIIIFVNLEDSNLNDYIMHPAHQNFLTELKKLDIVSKSVIDIM